jgi:hypothetical protein
MATHLETRGDQVSARDKFNGIDVEFWDCNDSEVLTHTDPISALEACVENHLDRASSVEDQIREMGAIPVEGYRRKKHDPSDINDAVDRALDAVVEALDDDDYGHPEGDAPMFKLEALARHRPAFDAAVRALVADARVWQVELAHTVELSPDETIEILRVERPEWFVPSPAAAGAECACGDNFEPVSTPHACQTAAPPEVSA